MLSFYPSDYPVAVVQGGPNAGRILFAHMNDDPDKRIPCRLSTLFKDDDFAVGRHVPDLDDLDTLYHAMDHGGTVPSHLAATYRRTLAEADRRQMRTYKHQGVGKLHVVPQAVPNQREMVLLQASSGCGKSTWIGDYLDHYRAAFPKNRVFLFTSKTEPDPAFDDLEPFDLTGFDEPPALSPEDLKDSLCIFDDIENISPKSIKDAVFALKKRLEETGRASNIYICVASHRAMRGNETKDDLNEADAFVVFPHRGTAHHQSRLLSTYGGLSKAQIKRVLEDTQNTRWAYVRHKGDLPPYVVTESEAFFL